MPGTFIVKKRNGLQTYSNLCPWGALLLQSNGGYFFLAAAFFLIFWFSNQWIKLLCFLAPASYNTPRAPGRVRMNPAPLQMTSIMPHRWSSMMVCCCRLDPIVLWPLMNIKSVSHSLYYGKIMPVVGVQFWGLKSNLWSSKTNSLETKKGLSDKVVRRGSVNNRCFFIHTPAEIRDADFGGFMKKLLIDCLRGPFV